MNERPFHAPRRIDAASIAAIVAGILSIGGTLRAEPYANLGTRPNKPPPGSRPRNKRREWKRARRAGRTMQGGKR